MLITFLCLICSLFCSAYAEVSKEPLFVSLGSHCEPAHMLKSSGLRKMAFPFDWIVSFDGEALIEMLDDDFLHFFHPLAFFPFGPAGHLFQSYYHLEFLHEGDFNGSQFLSNFEKLTVKYTRRIERFRALNSYEGKVFFIREAYEGSMNDPHRYYKCPDNIEITEEFASRLYGALQRRFLNLDFCLLIINHHAADHVEIEKKLSSRLLIIRANPSKEAGYLETKVSAYTRFFGEIIQEEF